MTAALMPRSDAGEDSGIKISPTDLCELCQHMYDSQGL